MAASSNAKSWLAMPAVELQAAPPSRTQRKLLRWAGSVAYMLVVAAIAAVTTLFATSDSRSQSRTPSPPEPPQLPSEPLVEPPCKYLPTSFTEDALTRGKLPASVSAALAEIALLIDRNVANATDAAIGDAAVAMLAYGDQIVWHYGTAAGSSRCTDISLDTVFGVGSVSKWVTALLAHVLALENGGPANLQKPIREYEPAGSLLSNEGFANITLSMLLSYQSGLGREVPRPCQAGYPQPAGASEHGCNLSSEEMLRAINHAVVPGPKLSPPPHYSNLGFALAGELLKEAAQSPYEALLQTCVTTTAPRASHAPPRPHPCPPSAASEACCMQAA